MLIETLTQCGVDPTHDDHTTAEWMSGWEADSVRTIASWVLRAAAAARPGPDILGAALGPQERRPS